MHQPRAPAWGFSHDRAHASAWGFFNDGPSPQADAWGYRTGARCFTSSNQLSTTWICGGPPPVCACPAGTTPIKCLPSGRMSYGLTNAGLAVVKPDFGARTGLPKLRLGLVVTLTLPNEAGPGM